MSDIDPREDDTFPVVEIEEDEFDPTPLPLEGLPQATRQFTANSRVEKKEEKDAS